MDHGSFSRLKISEFYPQQKKRNHMINNYLSELFQGEIPQSKIGSRYEALW